MKKYLFLFLLFPFVALAQTSQIPDFSDGNYTIINLQEDTVKPRERAEQALRSLKNGAVVVRLKTSQKSIAAYCAAGQNDVAERIEKDNKTRNQKIYDAFIENFTFCKLYFIYSYDTKDLLSGKTGLFLNSSLDKDTSILMTDTFFVFCEYGSANVYASTGTAKGELSWGRARGMAYSNEILDTVPSVSSSSPSSTSGLVFLDKNLTQFYRPFPYVEGVYLDGFKTAVRTLDRALDRAHYRLVTNQDFKEEVKKSRKASKGKP